MFTPNLIRKMAQVLNPLLRCENGMDWAAVNTDENIIESASFAKNRTV